MERQEAVEHAGQGPAELASKNSIKIQVK
jgi:hypothetical protein